MLGRTQADNSAMWPGGTAPVEQDEAVVGGLHVAQDAREAVEELG